MPVTLAVKAIPRASSNKIDGWTDSSRAELSVRVCAAPADGKANKAISELLAGSLGVAKTRVQIRRGATSRRKLIEIEVDEARFAAWREEIPVL